MINGVFTADNTTAITMRVQNDNRSGCFHGTSVSVHGRAAEIAGVSQDDFVEFLNVLGPGRSTLDLVTFHVYFKNAPNYYFECKITNRDIADIIIYDYDLNDGTDGYLIRFKFIPMFIRADQVRADQMRGTDLGEAVLPTFKWVRKKDQNHNESKSSKHTGKDETETPEKPNGDTSQQSTASDYKVTLN